MYTVGGCTLCKPNQDPSPAGACQTVLPTSGTNGSSESHKGAARGGRKAMSTVLYIKHIHPTAVSYVMNE